MTRFRKKTFMEDRRSVRLRRFFWLLGIALLFPQKQMHQTHEDYRSRRKVCGTQAAFCGAQRTPMRFRADAVRSITDALKRLL